MKELEAGSFFRTPPPPPQTHADVVAPPQPADKPAKIQTPQIQPPNPKQLAATPPRVLIPRSGGKAKYAIIPQGLVISSPDSKRLRLQMRCSFLIAIAQKLIH